MGGSEVRTMGTAADTSPVSELAKNRLERLVDASLEADVWLNARFGTLFNCVGFKESFSKLKIRRAISANSANNLKANSRNAPRFVGRRLLSEQYNNSDNVVVIKEDIRIWVRKLNEGNGNKFVKGR
jgi:hypothetical protein